MTRIFIAVTLMLCGIARAGDVADLFPAGTLAYLEVARPAETADAIAALLKQSPLADPAFTHDRLDAAAGAERTPGVLRAARLGLLGSPEVLAELRKVRGAAVALTGFTPRGEPKIAAAVQLGDSALLALAAKAFLTTTPDLRRVATADGVPVFQHRAFVGPLVGPEGKPFGPADEANPLRNKTPTAGTGEPTFALAPGLFVVGSGADEVADVLRRHAGKGAGPALALPDGRADGRGLSGFVAPAAAFAAFDAGKAADPVAAAWVRFLLNPPAVRRVAVRLRLRDNALSLVADFDAGGPCPLLDLLAGGAASVPAVAPADAAWAATITLPADRRAAAVLAVADAAAKAAGVVGRLPSDAVRAGDPDLFADVTAVTVFSPLKQSLPEGAVAWPVVVVHATPVGADRWARAVPRLVQQAAGLDAAPGPSSEVVGGVKVWTVPGAGLPWNAAVHYAANGSTFALGLDRQVVAAAARPGPAVPIAGTVGVVRPAGLSAQWCPVAANPKPAAAPGPEPRLLPGFVPHAVGPTGEAEPFAVGVGRAARHLPPVEFAVTRSGGAVRLTAGQRDLATPVAAAVREFLLWLETRPVEDCDTQEPPLVEPAPILR
jgi:hypothetical protein